MPQNIAIPRIIERPRIRRQLQEALERSHVFLTAPGGYGKSVSLQALVAHRPATHLVRVTVADLDPVTLQARLSPLLQDDQTIILDDIHLLEGGPEVCAWLEEQLLAAKPRWLLAGRRMPFNPTSLLITGQIIQLTQDFLAFSLAEAKSLLNQADAPVSRWFERLQGWPIALSLLSRLPTSDDPLPTTESHLFTYLAETVFSQLSIELKQFMQVTAIPTQFNIALAAELWTGEESAETLLAEIQRRNLYLQPTVQTGWFQYHDLIRDYLLQMDDSQRVALVEQTVSWYEAQNQIKTAVEQALAGGLKGRAADLLATLKLHHFHGDTSYLTYRRWVLSLDEDALATYPMILLRLGNVTSMMVEYQEESWTHTRNAFRFAEQIGEIDTIFLSRTNLALLHHGAGNLSLAHEEVMTVLADPACQGYPRLFGLRIATEILQDMGQFRAAYPLLTEAIDLAIARETQNEPFMNRANLSWNHMRLGKFELATQEVNAVLDHFADVPGWYSQYSTYRCELYVTQGNWSELAKILDEITVTFTQVEEAALQPQLWLKHYMTILAIINEDDASFQTNLAEYRTMTEQSRPLNSGCVAWLECWYLRKKGRWAAAIEVADAILTTSYDAPFYRACLALERDIALGMRIISEGDDDFVLHPETGQLIQWRARPQLVRVRALLAIVGWHQGDKRWRRHYRAAIRWVSYPGFDQLLTHRDPELGVKFWLIGMIEDIFVEEARSAWLALRRCEPLFPLLKADSPDIRARAATLLAEIGDERAMPSLTAVLSQETDLPTQRVIQVAIETLEALPPPLLTIQLLGQFSLQRGVDFIPDDAWPRPIVLRLFQYFVLNAGVALPKDQILDDLWPETDPAKAWNNFRTVYSLLRKVLEPYMRPKAPNRYVTVTGETYTFDLPRTAHIDVAEFETVVRHALRQRDTADALSISPMLLTALQSYSTVLPDLPYESWLLEPRERIQTLYIEGCLYVSEAYLAQGNNAEAVVWAKRTCHNAPWLEAAYQTLIRAYARQGQRTVALQTFAEATTQLKQELDVEPSPVTQWLAERLRVGEDI
ncbi:MAG: BTAD domain-containing putative transcriptional regulator [Chloroflexota bacterium]